ncbi:MAG: hypothetical protein L0Y57_14455, partial [Beijerinckiaceae bacterium]|nr:hypothetical protein [Beijerinckiaceae bacterium]
IAAKAHYLDITGEIDVFEAARLHDADAKAAGVVICPGAAFDLVPTDCIALMLKKALPEAIELSLGFDMSGVKMSAGTAKTFVEGLGKPCKVRRGGELADFPVGKGLRRIDFGRGEKLAMPIPWGDVATAYYTTGIPNITAYAPVSPVMAAMARLTAPLAPLFVSRGVQNWLKSWVEKNIGGPSEAEREMSRSWIWGEASDGRGRRLVIRIHTLNGYSLTVFCALAIAKYVLTHDCPPGFWTPAGLMGEDFILTLPGTSMLTSPQQAG